MELLRLQTLARYEAALARHALTVEELEVLVAVGRQPAITIGEIARMRGSPRTSLARVSARLVERKLLRAKRSSWVRLHLRLTEDGERALCDVLRETDPESDGVRT